MDFHLLARQLVRALRGKKSQRELSAALGYAYNVCYRWENGTSQIGWDQFIALCSHLDVRLSEALYGMILNYREPIDQSGHLVAHIISDRSQADVAAVMGCSRFKVSRWLSGDSVPKLWEVMKLFDSFGLGIHELVSLLVPLTELPLLSAKAAPAETAAQLQWRDPLISVLSYFVGMPEYRRLRRHQDGVLARLMNISVESEKKWVAELVALGVLHWHEGKLKATASDLFVVTDSLLRARVGLYWQTLGLNVFKKMLADGNRAIESTDLFSVTLLSKKARQEAHKILHRTFHELYSLSRRDRKEEGPQKAVYAMYFQLYRLDEALRLDEARKQSPGGEFTHSRE